MKNLKDSIEQKAVERERLQIELEVYTAL